MRGEEFEQDIRSAFRMIDVDNDGFITVPDLYQLMMGIGEMLTDDELMELLVTADHDGDGMVDYKGTNSHYVTNSSYMTRPPSPHFLEKKIKFLKIKFCM